jgi:hypothetical protein
MQHNELQAKHTWWLNERVIHNEAGMEADLSLVSLKTSSRTLIFIGKSMGSRSSEQGGDLIKLDFFQLFILTRTFS